MSGDQPTERLIQWLEQSDHLLLLDPTRESNGATSVFEERLQASDSEKHAPSSLEDTSHQEYRSYDELPQEIRLPDSHASSSIISHSRTDQNASNDSLEHILNAGAPVISPAISLSESKLPSEDTCERYTYDSVEASSTPRQRQRRRDLYPYGRTLENAAKVLDHIKLGNVCKHSRHARTYLVYYDYSNDLRSNRNEIYDANDIASLGNPPQHIQQRLLIVEDLSKPTIIALGETFCINPEFFEEHLLNSGYAGGEYDMLPAKMWATASLKKSYASMKWIRPVYRLPMYSWNWNMQDLAKSSPPDMEDRHKDVNGDEKPSKSENNIEHFTRYGIVTTRVSTNIFRREWRLWTDPQKITSIKRERGLEERFSVWKGMLSVRDCEIGKFFSIVERTAISFD